MTPARSCLEPTNSSGRHACWRMDSHLARDHAEPWPTVDHRPSKARSASGCRAATAEYRSRADERLNLDVSCKMFEESTKVKRSAIVDTRRAARTSPGCPISLGRCRLCCPAWNHEVFRNPFLNSK